MFISIFFKIFRKNSKFSQKTLIHKISIRTFTHHLERQAKVEPDDSLLMLQYQTITNNYCIFTNHHKTLAEKNFESATKELAEVLKKLDKKGKLGTSLNNQLTDAKKIHSH